MGNLSISCAVMTIIEGAKFADIGNIFFFFVFIITCTLLYKLLCNWCIRSKRIIEENQETSIIGGMRGIHVVNHQSTASASYDLEKNAIGSSSPLLQSSNNPKGQQTASLAVYQIAEIEKNVREYIINEMSQEMEQMKLKQKREYEEKLQELMITIDNMSQKYKHLELKLNNATTENEDKIQRFQETFENTTENLRQKLEQCELEVNLLKNKIFEIEKAKQMQNETEGRLMSQNSKEAFENQEYQNEKTVDDENAANYYPDNLTTKVEPIAISELSKGTAPSNYECDSIVQHKPKSMNFPMERICGLVNLGNTCYMNSTLQCLVHTVPLRDLFCTDKAVVVNLKNPDGMKGRLANAFKTLLIDMQQKDMVEPKHIKKLVGERNPLFKGNSQQDSQEFLSCLLDGLHEEVNEIIEKPYIDMTVVDSRESDEDAAKRCWEGHCKRDKSKIVDIFHGQIQCTLKCSECGFVQREFQAVSQLTLPLPYKKHISLGDCFDYFVSPHTTETKWLCDGCEKMVKMESCRKIVKLPQILTIHLKRFRTQNYSKQVKIKKKVSFPISLILDKYSEEPQVSYNLYGVINHYGDSLDSGHYVACVKHNENWYCCDDQSCFVVTEDEMDLTNNAYVLLYQRNEYSTTL